MNVRSWEGVVLQPPEQGKREIVRDAGNFDDVVRLDFEDICPLRERSQESLHIARRRVKEAPRAIAKWSIVVSVDLAACVRDPRARTGTKPDQHFSGRDVEPLKLFV